MRGPSTGKPAGISTTDVLALARDRPETHHIWRGSSLLVVDPRGAVGNVSLTGYFFRQARFLSRLQLEIGGVMPFRCSLAETSPNELEFVYIHPPVEFGGGGGSGSGGLARREGLLVRDVDVRLRYRVRPASLEATLWITSRWQEIPLDVTWKLGADFASIDEAHFGFRQQEAEIETIVGKGGISYRYLHPDLPFETRIAASGAEWVAAADALSVRLELVRQSTARLVLNVRAVDAENPIGEAGEHAREARLQRWFGTAVTVESPGNPPLIEITRRAVRDLGSLTLLEGAEDEWLRPGAGVPLYLTFWARDGLTTGWQMGLYDRGDMLADVLTFLTRTRGERVDPALDEEPGRIINQARTDPFARLGTTPFSRYYADFASPFMFVIGLGYLYVLTGDVEQVRPTWEAALGVIDWARRYADRDGDGYLEYLTTAEEGPTHQGWKDSENAVVDEFGRQVAPPIAPAEIQGYYHAALQYVAALSAVLGERDAAREFWREARALKERFNRDFWMENEGCLAFGLDSEKRQIRAITSNAAHCLATGIVADDHIVPLVRRMFEPDMFSGWGIRTLSTRNPAYNPLDYHLGSVWPVENATILFGLRRYGLNAETVRLAEGLLDLMRIWPGGRVPECVGGYARSEAGHPGVYPRANTPQTWNQSVPPLILQSLLGMVPVAPLRLLLVDPLLPDWLPEVMLRGIRIGEATVSLRFWRDPAGRSRYEVLEKHGRVRVVRQPWLESRSAGGVDRVGPVVARMWRRGAR